MLSTANLNHQAEQRAAILRWHFTEGFQRSSMRSMHGDHPLSLGAAEQSDGRNVQLAAFH